VLELQRPIQRRFHFPADRHGQREALRIKGPRRSGDVDHPEQLPVPWIAHRRCRAGPTLHILAEMLGPEDTDGSPFRESLSRWRWCRSRPPPNFRRLQGGCAGLGRDPRIAGCLNDESTRIGQDHHGGGFCEEEAGPLQSRAGGGQKHGILTAAAEHFRLPGEWRLLTFYRHAERSRPLPGGCDALRNSLGRLSLQQEGFPRPSEFRAVVPRFSFPVSSVGEIPAVTAAQ